MNKFKSRTEALAAVKYLADEASALQGCRHPDECDEARAYIRELQRKLNRLIRKSIATKKVSRTRKEQHLGS